MLLIEITLCFCEEYSFDFSDEKELIDGILTVCQSKEMGTKEDSDLIMTMKVPSSKEGKCMVACVLESAGIVS